MEPAVRERILRSVLSLLATLLGWGAASLSWLLYVDLLQGIYQLQVGATDFSVMFLWAGLFIILGWLFFFHPLVSWLPAEHRLFGPLVFPFVGIALAMVAFLLLVASWFNDWRSLFGYLYAGVAGGVAAFLYSWANRALLMRRELLLLRREQTI